MKHSLTKQFEATHIAFGGTKGLVLQCVLAALVLVAARPSNAETLEASGFDQYPSAYILGETYAIQGNFHNPPTDASSFHMDYNTSNSTWDVNEFLASTTGIDSLAFPHIFKGCSWGACTSTGSELDGGDFPLQVQKIVELSTTWQTSYEYPQDSDEWNASYVIWANQTEPQIPLQLDQNDGAKIVIVKKWEGSEAPIGQLVETFSYPTPNETIVNFDVYTAQQGTEPLTWNVITYVPQSGTSAEDFEAIVQVDAKKFLLNARTLDCNGTACLDDEWWITSAQSGFEIWNLTSAGILNNESFRLVPIAMDTTNFVLGTRINADGEPLVNWRDEIPLRASACPDAAVATWEMTVGADVYSGDMLEDVDHPGFYSGTVPAVHPSHGEGTVDFHFQCGPLPGADDIDLQGTIYVDPSGIVSDQFGSPIDGAEVTLFCSFSDRPYNFFQIADQDTTYMDPSININNPDSTDFNGYYRWDVARDLWYKVRVTKGGCHAPGNPDVEYVESDIRYVEDLPHTDVHMTMECPNGSILGGEIDSGDDNSNVELSITDDWGTGYCATVTVTNNEATPVDWSATFDVEGYIYTFWNVEYVLSGNQVSISGVGWNRVLQPGESTHSLGYCANR